MVGEAFRRGSNPVPRPASRGWASGGRGPRPAGLDEEADHAKKDLRGLVQGYFDPFFFLVPCQQIALFFFLSSLFSRLKIFLPLCQFFRRIERGGGLIPYLFSWPVQPASSFIHARLSAEDRPQLAARAEHFPFQSADFCVCV